MTYVQKGASHSDTDSNLEIFFTIPKEAKRGKKTIWLQQLGNSPGYQLPLEKNN